LLKKLLIFLLKIMVSLHSAHCVSFVVELIKFQLDVVGSKTDFGCSFLDLLEENRDLFLCGSCGGRNAMLNFHAVVGSAQIGQNLLELVCLDDEVINDSLGICLPFFSVDFLG